MAHGIGAIKAGFSPGARLSPGMYIVELAVSDSRLAGAIGQAPLVDGFAAAKLASPGRGLRLLAAALLDRLGSVFGRPPRYLPGAGRPGELAIGGHRGRPLRGEAHDSERLNRMA